MYTKKSLAQHFLRDSRILGKIAGAAKIAPTETALEVGPGEGALTALLLARAGKVIAVEKDARLIPLLRQKFAREIAVGKLSLIHADILDFDLCSMLHVTCYKVVANLPYYITGKFLRKFLQSDCQPSSMTLLLQKEVAARIIAEDKKESILSMSVKCFGEPRIIGTVKAGSFSPPPKVDSAILAIENISKKFFRKLICHACESRHPEDVSQDLDSSFRWNDAEARFFMLLKKGFAHPRKLLSSNLGIAPETLRAAGIPENARAENLTLSQWKRLATSV